MATPLDREVTGTRPWRKSLRAALPALGLAALVTFSPVAACAADARAGRVAASAELPALPFDHFMGYDEFTGLLQAWAAARPDLVKLESIGRSPEGREVWFLTLTNGATGPASAKPALLVDGNMHAVEWSGGVAVLNFTWKLLRDYGRDANVTRLLDTRTVYVLPRMTPDGVEATLRGGKIIRSAIRPGKDDKLQAGLRMRDLDGDGQIVFMRYRDPNGAWKQDTRDSRLMVPRGPLDTAGDTWRVVPEGLIEGGFNGETFEVLNALDGIDFGVFFPDPRDPVPAGAVTDPDAQRVPEVAAYVKAIRERPNIFAHVTCHNFGGLLLTPPVNPVDEMPSPDRHFYEAMGQKIAATMGYVPMSYLELRGGRELDTFIPTEMGWLYERLGIYSFITEFWNLLDAAGIEVEGPVSTWLGGMHPIEDELKLLAWNDTALGGKAFVRWHAFDHPQLGPVEIGGWDKVNYWYNPPLDRLQQEIAPHAEWLLELALASPQVAVRSFTATRSGKDRWQLRLVIDNIGWLPTSGSARAADLKVVDGVRAELHLPAGVRLGAGEPVQNVGELKGGSEQRSLATWWGYEPGTPDRAVADWIVSAPAGTKLAVTVSHPRAGQAAAAVILGR
jgi:murein tripeptide amidase MpaA